MYITKLQNSLTRGARRRKSLITIQKEHLFHMDGCSFYVQPPGGCFVYFLQIYFYCISIVIFIWSAKPV